jgi:hypothetical protein
MSDREYADELQTRRAKFLAVEKVGDRYKETNLKGEVKTYAPDRRSPQFSLEHMAFHTVVDIPSGGTRPLITGRTGEGFRAIGTEGAYQILDVRITSEATPGVVSIRHTYAPDGHNLNSSMVVGLTNESINALHDGISGTLYLSDLTGHSTYGTEHLRRADGATGLCIVLPDWKESATEAKDEVSAEWQFTFKDATLSPRGYMQLLGYFEPGKEISLRNHVGIFFQPESAHPLTPAIQELSSAVALVAKRLARMQLVVIGILVVLVLELLRH